MSKPLPRATVVLPWDLHPSQSAFPKTPREGSLVVLESRAKANALPFHRQKLAMVVSALRHFTEERRAAGFHVEHVVADDYASGIREYARKEKPRELHMMAPREWAIDARIRALSQELPLTVHDDGGAGGHFLLTRAEFAHWAGGRKHLRMDQFYAALRKRLNVLVDAGGQPEGGRFSFDAENREHARGVKPPPIPWVRPDELTQQAMRFAQRVGHFGALEPFGWPVTRKQALKWLENFCVHRLPDFGRYEDAIRSDERFLFHSLLSAPLNLGLLAPRELIDAALDQYRQQRAPLASVEGFIRQVLGWREFMRGVYWHLMPQLRSANQLSATLPLPDFFWEPERTELQCLREALSSVRDTGYTHHIQRLMVICNYATLAGIDPRAVSHWFWAGFVDAYEWVELPNVVGMGLHGTSAFTTKPYVASAAYVKRQTGLTKKNPNEAPCARCRFDPDERVGPNACPYNFLYWDFMAQNRKRLEVNPRVGQVTKNLDRFGADEVKQLRAQAKAHREALRPYSPAWHVDEDAG